MLKIMLHQIIMVHLVMLEELHLVVSGIIRVIFINILTFTMVEVHLLIVLDVQDMVLVMMDGIKKIMV